MQGNGNDDSDKQYRSQQQPLNSRWHGRPAGWRCRDAP
jgi:hypothetical protein